MLQKDEKWGKSFFSGFKCAPPKALLFTAVEFAFFFSTLLISPRDNVSRASSPAYPKATKGRVRTVHAVDILRMDKLVTNTLGLPL